MIEQSLNAAEEIEVVFDAFGICDRVFKPNLTVNDIGISYRTINNWETNGLMIAQRKNARDWHKFSFVDYVWLNVIYELRQLGFPLNKVKMIKAALIDDLVEDELMYVARIEARIFASNKKMSLLIRLLAEIIGRKNHIALLCNKSGELHCFNESIVKKGKADFDFGHLLNNNFVCVSLTDIVMKYLFSIKIENIRDLRIMPESNVSVLEKLRSKKIDQLIFIRSETSPLELTETLFETYQQFSTAALRLMLTMPYDEILSK